MICSSTYPKYLYSLQCGSGHANHHCWEGSHAQDLTTQPSTSTSKDEEVCRPQQDIAQFWSRRHGIFENATLSRNCTRTEEFLEAHLQMVWSIPCHEESGTCCIPITSTTGNTTPWRFPCQSAKKHLGKTVVPNASLPLVTSEGKAKTTPLAVLQRR
jgi:hypothetical protein